MSKMVLSSSSTPSVHCLSFREKWKILSYLQCTWNMDFFFFSVARRCSPMNIKRNVIQTQWLFFPWPWKKKNGKKVGQMVWTKSINTLTKSPLIDFTQRENPLFPSLFCSISIISYLVCFNYTNFLSNYRLS